MNEVEKLPESEQDAVAALVLEELASEQRWTELFAKSQDKLAKLAENALADHSRRSMTRCRFTPCEGLSKDVADIIEKALA